MGEWGPWNLSHRPSSYRDKMSMREEKGCRFPASPLSLLCSILNWVNMFHVLSLMLVDNNCRIHGGFWGFFLFFHNIWWCFASPLTPWLKPRAPTVAPMPQEVWFPYVFFSMYNRKKDEKVLTSNRSDNSLSYTHMWAWTHAHTEPRGVVTLVSLMRSLWGPGSSGSSEEQ